MMRARFLAAVAATLLLFPVARSADAPSAGSVARPGGPLSPKDELGTFRVLPGFKVELVASEPEVIDPVAMTIDEKGRIFVCEMRGYPNGGVGTGNESRGRIKCLTDKDGDGVFETATIFAEGLRFPMGVTPWENGVIVAVAPDILYLHDANGDGKADTTTKLYTGFNLANIQQMVNTLQWGLDGWIYGLAGNNAGTITSGQKPDAPAVTLQARGFRFKPDVPASLEPTSGGGQYGLASDDFGHWFTSTNSQHLRQIVIPDHYLRRNPAALVTAVTLDIPDHGAACKLHRISPFEAWRVERTTRRAGSPDAKRFPSNELVPGGFATSSCSPVVYTAGLFPEAFRNNTFVCDPANNLVHRDVLKPTSAIFTAARGDADCEFFASTDNWCRPVSLTVGPDGALYLLDFYREAIETPLSLPEDIKAKLNLESRDRGRIWRIAPTGFRAKKFPDLAAESSDQLVARLADPSAWTRTTANRLLYERRDRSVVAKLVDLAKQSSGKSHLAAVLHALNHFGGVTDELILAGLTDELPGNREVALRFAEPRLEKSEALRAAVVKMTADPVPMVRFQLALTAGFLPEKDAAPVLAALIRTDAGDPWTTSAVLCSLRTGAATLLASILEGGKTTPENAAAIRGFVLKSAIGVGNRRDEGELVRLVQLAAEGKGGEALLDLAVLEGLGQGMRSKKPTLAEWLATPPALAAPAAGTMGTRFSKAAETLKKPASPTEAANAARLLAFAPFDVSVTVLASQISAQTPVDVSLAAVRSLSAQSDPSVPDLLLKRWPELGPSVRREILEQLLSVPSRVPAVLDAVEKGTLKPADLEPARIAQLKAHANKSIGARATKLLAATGSADRKKLIDEFKATLELTGTAEKGQKVFKQHCAACHKLGTEGHEVGPNLLAVVPGKSGDDLLVSVLDPNREVDPRYLNYLLDTVDGRSLTGIVVAETSAAITIRRPDGAEDTIRRGDIDRLRSSGLSLMPEGLEKNVQKQDLADLFAYLRQVAGKPMK